jgi:hypothetical protein
MTEIGEEGEKTRDDLGDQRCCSGEKKKEKREEQIKHSAVLLTQTEQPRSLLWFITNCSFLVFLLPSQHIFFIFLQARQTPPRIGRCLFIVVSHVRWYWCFFVTLGPFPSFDRVFGT